MEPPDISGGGHPGFRGHADTAKDGIVHNTPWAETGYHEVRELPAAQVERLTRRSIGHRRPPTVRLPGTPRQYPRPPKANLNGPHTHKYSIGGVSSIVRSILVHTP